MNDYNTIIILSDLHVGGGNIDPGDDHVYHNNQLVNYLKELALTPEGRAGKVELFFNGDFLEFAQTNDKAFSHQSDKSWCSEEESLEKLNTILTGHPEIFSAILEFQENGNLVTIASGNHDVDLYWKKVQNKIREVSGLGINFEIGKEWVERYDGKLQIAHGHMSDVANKFDNWADPISKNKTDVPCLEMCPGTLFMVKFVNKLEARYPFADNLLPVTKLATVLLNDDKSGFMSVGWMFARMMASTSPAVLGSDSKEDFGYRLIQNIQNSSRRSAILDSFLLENGLLSERAHLKARSLSQDMLSSIMFYLLGRIDIRKWIDMFEPRGGVLLGEGVTLSAISKASYIDGKKLLREVAKDRNKATGAQVVVMGHTHQVDVMHGDDFSYYNPGSWTRYLEIEKDRKITLADLECEENYPYQLNVIRVSLQDQNLTSEMICIDRYDPPLHRV